nr:PREDICTED: lysosomal protective protein-like isoform X2 [Latimeria chalumnae]|eukprot:XP_014349153.1 PREDICTED: lysosomal protective protein-like isoform X2 [Latimeria chalumnae]
MEGFLYCVCWVLIPLAFCQFVADEVTGLPGLSTKPSFRQWSGYLKAGQGKFLHYWFVTSQQNPLKDPLVLWLNGGPGCSSLDGFLSENGPFHVNDDGATLYINEFSWNKIANVLYLEAPAGVGYSYSVDKNYQTDDDKVAENNYLALQSFFVKFPNFTQNDFYVFGESYGGIYTPTLSLKIATGAAKINFKGFAIGNGLTSYALNDQSLIYFGYYHGLFGDILWADLNRHCCQDGNCNFYKNPNPECALVVQQALYIVYDTGLNIYSLYLDCAGGVGPRAQRLQMDISHLFRFYSFKLPSFLAKERAKFDPPCINGTAQHKWLNQADVRKALHIPDSVQTWELCSKEVGEQYSRLYETMFDFYQKLLAMGLRVLVYNGDTDMACNFLGDQWFVQSLSLKGAGHMVPQWAPGQAFKMFQSFLTNSPY